MRGATPDRDLLVSGHVNVDRFLRVARFPGPDRTVPVLADRLELGGTATNLALVAAAHRLRVGLLARIGDGFPAAFRQRLGRAGIDLTGLREVRGEATPTCFIVEGPGGAQRTLIDQGPMRDGVRASLPRRWIARHAWVHLGTGPPGTQLRVAEAARDAGRSVAIDPAQEIFYRWTSARFRRLLASAELLFGNAAEIERACRLAGAADVRALLARVPLVVRTEGARGASAFSRTGVVRARGRPIRRIRSLVGAGDAFRGGFYGAYLRGRTLDRCLRAANAAASAWIAGRR